MHILCNDLIFDLNPHFSSPSSRRSTKLNEEEAVSMATASDIDKLNFHC